VAEAISIALKKAMIGNITQQGLSLFSFQYINQYIAKTHA
jgi:hypothetical protein